MMGDITDLRAIPEPELRQRLLQTRKDLNARRLKAKQGIAEQPHKIRQTRRDIARMLTALREQGQPSVTPPVKTGS